MCSVDNIVDTEGIGQRWKFGYIIIRDYVCACAVLRCRIQMFLHGNVDVNARKSLMWMQIALHIQDHGVQIQTDIYAMSSIGQFGWSTYMTLSFDVD